MSGFLILLLLFAVAWLMLKWTEMRERIGSLEARLNHLELQRLRAEPQPAPTPAPVAPSPTPAPILRPPAIPQPPSGPFIAPPARPAAPLPASAPAPAQIHWEKFLGVKLFAWVG